ncbi:hypothetical protein DFH09DRAFT_67768 [Mycena vulgaris]|nr:hypothetical protein DFH09DRAFT_67768 [Mycena vulgaris]
MANAPLADTSGLKRIVLYLGFCTLLQISSGSIFVHTSTAHLDIWSSDLDWGSRFGAFDQLWQSVTSSSDTELFRPAVRNAAVNMFAGQTNNTRHPGLHGRLLHDTVNLDISSSGEVPWATARLNAALINVHCSQISNATINTFTLSRGSTDLKLAQPSPPVGEKRFLFQNTSSSEDRDPWINVSISAPSYWDPKVPGLNIVGYWGFTDTLGVLTKVFFQPWAFNCPEDDRGPVAIGCQLSIVRVHVAFGARIAGNRRGRQHSAAGARSEWAARQCADVQSGVQNPVGGGRRRGDGRQVDGESGEGDHRHRFEDAVEIR